jgi:hypothetical protein
VPVRVEEFDLGNGSLTPRLWRRTGGHILWRTTGGRRIGCGIRQQAVASGGGGSVADVGGGGAGVRAVCGRGAEAWLHGG